MNRDQLEQLKRRHINLLNALEPHLGCVVCRGPLIRGACPTCQPVPEPSEGTPKLPADHSLCDLPCDLPDEAHDG